MKKLIAIIALACATSAHAVEWKYDNQNADGVKFYTSNLREVSSTIFTIWRMVQLTDGTSQKYQMMVDCATSTYTVLNYFVFDSKGNTTASQPNIQNLTVYPIVPGSMIDDGASPVCERMKNKAAGMKQL